MENEREKCERACAAQQNPNITERSLFYRAFVRTGCLVDIDGKYDQDICVHKDLPPGKEFLDTVYQNSPAVEPQQAQVEDCKSEGSGEDTEDEDDDPPEDSEDEREPIPDEMEIGEISDERDLIKAAESEIPVDDTEQLLDFRFARRVAGQHGTTAYVSTYHAVTATSDANDSGRRHSNRKRKQIYSTLTGL